LSFNVHSPRDNTRPFQAYEHHLGEVHDKIVKLHAVQPFGVDGNPGVEVAFHSSNVRHPTACSAMVLKARRPAPSGRRAFFVSARLRRLPRGLGIPLGSLASRAISARVSRLG